MLRRDDGQGTGERNVWFAFEGRRRQFLEKRRQVFAIKHAVVVYIQAFEVFRAQQIGDLVVLDESVIVDVNVVHQIFRDKHSQNDCHFIGIDDVIAICIQETEQRLLQVRIPIGYFRIGQAAVAVSVYEGPCDGEKRVGMERGQGAGRFGSILAFFFPFLWRCGSSVLTVNHTVAVQIDFGKLIRG